MLWLGRIFFFFFFFLGPSSVSPLDTRNGTSTLKEGCDHAMRSLLQRPRVHTPRLPFCHAQSSTRSCATSFSEQTIRWLKSRQIPFAYDYLHPQPSHLLNLTLLDLFTKAESIIPATSLPSIASPSSLAAGHHLVYFPPQVPLSQLLPDGTDILHSPGPPFNRRLWVGGRLSLAPTGLLLDGSRAVCIESIRDVMVRGREGDEKIFVEIERRFGTVNEAEDEGSIKSRLWREDGADFGQAPIIEIRTLVFMRDKTEEQVRHDKQHFGNRDRAVRCAY